MQHYNYSTIMHSSGKRNRVPWFLSNYYRPGGYPIRHPYYNQRMPPPNHQRPPFQPQGTPQVPMPQQPNSVAQMRPMGPGPNMSQPGGYPNMYRDHNR